MKKQRRPVSTLLLNAAIADRKMAGDKDSVNTLIGYKGTNKLSTYKPRSNTKISLDQPGKTILQTNGKLERQKPKERGSRHDDATRKRRENIPRPVTKPDSKSEEKLGAVDWWKNVGAGAVKSSASGIGNLVGVWHDLTQGVRDQAVEADTVSKRRAVEREQQKLDMMLKNPAAYGKARIRGQRQAVKVAENILKAIERAPEEDRETTKRLYAGSDKMAQSAAENIQAAKQGQTGFMKLVTDATVATLQSGTDALVGVLTGAGMAPFAARAFGAGAQEARRNGASPEKAALYGTAQAAKEVLTEKIFNVGIFKTAYGKGSLDDATEKFVGELVNKMTKSPQGQRALGGLLTVGTGAVGEGLEEVVGDLIEPILPKIYGGEIEPLKAADVAYDFLVGAVSGTMGTAVSPSTYRYQLPDNVVNKGVQTKATQNAMKVPESTSEADEGNAATSQKSVMVEMAIEGYKQQGMTPKKARRKAYTMERAVNGQELAREEVNRFDLSSEDSRRIFSELTGVRFREGKMSDAEAVKAAFTRTKDGKYILNKPVETAAEEAAMAEDPASAETEALEETRNAQEAAREAAEDEILESESDDMGKQKLSQQRPTVRRMNEDTIYMNGRPFTRQQVRELAKTNGETDMEMVDSVFDAEVSRMADGGVGDTFEVFREQAERMNPGIKEDEVQELYTSYVKDSRVYKAKDGSIFTREGIRAIIGDGKGTKVDDAALDAQIQEMLNSGELSETGGAETLKDNGKPSVVLADAGLAEDASGLYKRFNRQTRRTLDKLGKQLGTRIEVVETLAGGWANGMYSTEDGVIYIAADAKNPVLAVAAHEATHRMEELSPSEFQRYRDYAVEKAAEGRGISERELLREYEEQYNGKNGMGQDLSYDELKSEIAADLTEDMLASTQRFQELVRDDRSIAQKLCDAVKDFIDRVRGVQTKDTAPRSESKFGVGLRDLEAAADAWMDALDAAQARVQDIKDSGNTSDGQKNAAQERTHLWYQKKGVRPDGVEIYETSDEVKAMPWKQRIEAFMELMRGEYAGRTAKFTVNDDVRYAKFEERDVSKNIYGDKRSSRNGWKAKINTGADGNIFELVENARYDGSRAESGKTTRAHKEVTGWEYFVKVVQVDGRVYDLLANVRKKPDGDYVYSIQLNENKKKAPAPPVATTKPSAKALDGYASDRVPTDATKGSIAEDERTVKERFSAKRADRISELEKENRKLREQLERAKGETKQSTPGQVDPRAAKQVAERLVKDYDSTITAQDIQDDLTSLYDFIGGNMEKPDFDGLAAEKQARAIAERIVDGSVTVDDQMYKDYADLRKRVKDTKISISKEDSADIADFGDFRKRNAGRMTIAKDGTPVDVLYQDLSMEYPEFFNEKKYFTPSGQLVHISEVLGQIYDRPEINPFAEMRNEVIQDVTNDILDSSLDAKKRNVFADRRAKELQEAKEHGKQRVREVRGQKNEKIEELRAMVKKKQQEAARNERRAARAEKRAQEAKETLVAQKSAAKMDSISWLIYHKAEVRQMRRKAEAKARRVQQRHNEELKREISREREIARAEVEVARDEERAKAAEAKKKIREKAAERLGIVETAYRQKLSDTRTLNRPEAKRVLSNQRLNDKAHKRIIEEQGPVKVIRDNPKEMPFIEKVQSGGEKLRGLGRTAYRNFVNTALEVDMVAHRQRGGTLASTLVTVSGGSSSTVSSIYTTALVDRAGNRMGDSMKETFLVMENGTYNEAKQAVLQGYILCLHNTDRMSFEAKAQKALSKFTEEHPWLKNMAPKEIAKLAAMTEAEAKRGGKEKERAVAVQYAELLDRAVSAKNKPVLGDENGNAVSAETSRKLAEELAKENPWVVEKANGIFDWWDKFMREWGVASGLLSEDQYNAMRDMYPHYAPTFRKDKGGAGGSGYVGRGTASVSGIIKAATGSVKDIVNIEDSYADQLQKVVRSARLNELYSNLIDTAMLDEDGTFEDLMAFDWETWQPGAYGETLLEDALLNGEPLSEIEKDIKEGLSKDGQNYRLTGWHNGRKYSAYISQDLYTSLLSLSGNDVGAFECGGIRLGNKLTGPMKAAITGLNPFFALRNVSRDLPTAIINSISGAAFPKYWARAAKEIAQGSEAWGTFQALGGTHAGYYNNENGFVKNMTKKDSLGRKAVEKLGAFNEVTEAQTRFAEYLATIDRLGDSYENRLLGIKNAAEVTVDFSRRGRFGSVINAWVPYWNPAVQGIDKMLRSVVDAPEGQKIWKQAMKTIGRAGVITLLPEIIAYAAMKASGDYDDWEELDDRTKDTYYTIPTGDGEFIKIPKNREWGAILGTPLMRILEGYNGREDPFENYIETCLLPNFIPPAIIGMDADGKFSSDIIGVGWALDLANNKDFAGRTIVPHDLEGGSLSGQYDAETSLFTRGLAKLVGNRISPIQADFIIKSYFGDFGKLFVAATSESTVGGVLSGEATPEELADKFLSIVRTPFMADNRYNNYSVGKYYETVDELTKLVNDKKNHLPEGEYKDSLEYKTLEGMKQLYGKEITGLNKEARELPKSQKKDELKAEISALAGNAIKFFDQSMSGEILEPQLAAKYADLPTAVANELIRLDRYTESYSITPSGYIPTSYTDPQYKRREYVLDDEAKQKYREIYDRMYQQQLTEVIGTSRYRTASDEKKLDLLEGGKEDAGDNARKEFMKWLKKNRTSTRKRG